MDRHRSAPAGRRAPRQQAAAAAHPVRQCSLAVQFGQGQGKRSAAAKHAAAPFHASKPGRKAAAAVPRAGQQPRRHGSAPAGPASAAGTAAATRGTSAARCRHLWAGGRQAVVVEGRLRRRALAPPPPYGRRRRRRRGGLTLCGRRGGRRKLPDLLGLAQRPGADRGLQRRRRGAGCWAGGRNLRPAAAGPGPSQPTHQPLGRGAADVGQERHRVLGRTLSSPWARPGAQRPPRCDPRGSAIATQRSRAARRPPTRVPAGANEATRGARCQDSLPAPQITSRPTPTPWIAAASGRRPRRSSQCLAVSAATD